VEDELLHRSPSGPELARGGGHRAPAGQGYRRRASSLEASIIDADPIAPRSCGNLGVENLAVVADVRRRSPWPLWIWPASAASHDVEEARPSRATAADVRIFGVRLRLLMEGPLAAGRRPCAGPGKRAVGAAAKRSRPRISSGVICDAWVLVVSFGTHGERPYLSLWCAGRW